MPQEGQSQTSQHSDFSAIKEDLAALREDLQGVLEQVLDSGRERGSALKDKLVETGRKLAEPAEKTVRERPLASILVIFLVGLVLGKLIDFGRHG